MIKVTFELRDSARTIEEVVAMVKRSELWAASKEWEVVAKSDPPPMGGGAGAWPPGGGGYPRGGVGGTGSGGVASVSFGSGAGIGTVPVVEGADGVQTFTVPVGGPGPNTIPRGSHVPVYGSGGGGGTLGGTTPVPKAKKLTWRERLGRWLYDNGC